MSIFDRFKRKPPKIRLKIAQVVRWLDVVMDSKGINRHSLAYKEKIDQNISLLRSVLDELSGASISANPYILRLRKTFLKRFPDYLDLIRLPSEPLQIAVYTTHIATATEDFLEEQQKIIFRLAEYYPAAKNIVTILDSIDKETTDYINRINRKDFLKVIEARKLLQKYNVTKEKRQILDEQIRLLESQKDDPLQRLAKIQKRLSELTNTNNYRVFKEVKKEYDLVLERSKKTEQPLKNHFRALKPALERLKEKDSRKDLIMDYLKSPIDTLLADQSLVILDILKDVKAKMGKFGFSEAQTKRMDKHLGQMTKGYLQQQVLKVKKLRKKLDELDVMVKRNTTRMLVAEQEHQQELVQERLISIEDKIQELEREKEPLSVRLAYQKLRDKLKELNDRIELLAEREDDGS